MMLFGVFVGWKWWRLLAARARVGRCGIRSWHGLQKQVSPSLKPVSLVREWVKRGRSGQVRLFGLGDGGWGVELQSGRGRG